MSCIVTVVTDERLEVVHPIQKNKIISIFR